MLKGLVKENQYQQQVLAKKIPTTEKKYAYNVKALQLVNFLASREDKNEKQDDNLLKAIVARVTKVIDNNGLDLLAVYQIKQELLQQEALLLNAALKGMD